MGARPVRLAGLVLAGGLGRRMGGADKAFLMLNGRPLIAHALARLTPQVDAVAISANGDPLRFAEFGTIVLPDAGGAGAGPLAGVLAGLGWAKGLGADALVTVAVDTPFFPANLAERLWTGGGDQGRTVLASDARGPHPTFALWPVSAEDALAAAFAEGARRVEGAAQALGSIRAEFAGAGDVFFNINTPDDLATASRRADA